MDRQAWTDAVLRLAKASGCEAAETFSLARDAFAVSILHGEIDRYSVSKTGGVGLRVQLHGHDGYAYTECYDDPEGLVAHAVDNAVCIESIDMHPMQCKRDYALVTSPSSPLDNLDAAQKIDLVKRLEQSTLRMDARVQRVIACAVQTGVGNVEIQNTAGLLARRDASAALIYVEPLVCQNGETKTGFAFRMGAEAADVEGCAREAVANAVEQFGGAPISSGNYRVILKNTAMADLLTAFCGIFSAEQAQKGCSLLSRREGEVIASPLITLVDDPFDPIAPRAFDDEGTPCMTKAIIDNGRFITLLHNLKTAAKAGVESTGNAVRASAAANVGVGPHILLLKPGESDFGALVAALDDGIIINDLQGLHAGVNAVSGDFSLKATGRRVIAGKDVGAVCDITVAGNLLELFKNVGCVGDDVQFTMPAQCYTACPSVLIEHLQIGGK